jgi:hypothetical protein
MIDLTDIEAEEKASRSSEKEEPVKGHGKRHVHQFPVGELPSNLLDLMFSRYLNIVLPDEEFVSCRCEECLERLQTFHACFLSGAAAVLSVLQWTKNGEIEENQCAMVLDNMESLINKTCNVHDEKIENLGKKEQTNG